MKNPDQASRRAVIREWMAQPADKRQSMLDAADFAKKAVERHKLIGPGDPIERIRIWLLPRVGRK
jgi:hypothetical protein